MNGTNKQELAQGYINLKEHFDSILLEREKQQELHFNLIQEALKLSSSNLEKRLETLNELRQSVEKDRVEFVRQETYNIKTTFYDNWCRGVDYKLTQIETSQRTWIIAIGVFFTVLQIVLKYWK